ncbi:MAG: Uma2 family endonuclease [Verrucomicrobia bacterium]|nr:Uma2 family endonuclease [Verrucomicrobiota bacterium]
MPRLRSSSRTNSPRSDDPCRPSSSHATAFYSASGVEPNYLDGPADLAVEIISPGSRGLDRGEKHFEYELSGVPEYWIVDPQRGETEFYLRDKDGIYRLQVVGSEGIYRSRALPGLWIKVDWLWQRPLPPILTILKEWGWSKSHSSKI